jgi:SAM-dependent methyltransferase
MNYQLRKFEKRKRVENPSQARAKVLNDGFLTNVYLEILTALLKNRDIGNQNVVEIGSAGGITKQYFPSVVTSDIREADGVDLVLNATETLPFKDSSVDLLIAKDVLHHISDTIAHFHEIERILKQGGSAVYAEPNWNLLSRLIFRFVHPEPYFPKGDWVFESSDPMYSNQALPYILFVRDIDRFNTVFPRFNVELAPPLNGVAFLISGGVFRRSKISSEILIRLNAWETKHLKWMKHVGLTRIIKISKI